MPLPDATEIIPVDAFSIREHKLRRMVARSATFAAFTGLAWPNTLDRVHLREWDESLLTPDIISSMPLAIIDTDRNDYERPPHLHAAGECTLFLAVALPDDYPDPQDGNTVKPVRTHKVNRRRYVSNFSGGVIGDLARMSGNDQVYDDVITSSELECSIKYFGGNLNEDEEEPLHGIFAWEAYAITDARAS